MISTPNLPENKDTAKPVLSIVIPVFNQDGFVKIMIDSILANSFKDYELLLIDDGSNQDTLDLLYDYEHTDGRIKVVQRDSLPKGAPTCRNIGFDLAVGEYIIFFDSDDYISPDCLETRVKAISQHNDLDFIVFPSGAYDNGTISADDISKCLGYKLFKDDIKAFAQRFLPFYVVNNIYRTSSIRKAGIRWDTELLSLQDADFNMLALLSDLKYDFHLCNPDYGYRTSGNEGSVSKKIYTPRHFCSHIHALDKFYRTIQAKYGSKYDKFLYRGTVWMFNTICHSSYDGSFVEQLIGTIKKYDKKRGDLFAAQMRLIKVLMTFLPFNLARRIALFNYLRQRAYIIKKYKPGKIKYFLRIQSK